MINHQQIALSASTGGVAFGEVTRVSAGGGRKWNFAKRAQSELGLLKGEFSLGNKFMDDSGRMHRISLMEAEAGWTI